MAARALARSADPAGGVRWVGHPALTAGVAALVVLALTYGRGLAEGRVIVPADLLTAFPPWTATLADPEPPANGLLGDQIQQMYPWRAFVHDELAAGRFPLWNPYAGGGVPLFANGQSAILFPLNLTVLWLDPAWAATVVQLAKPPLAAVGGALFLRALGAGAAASTFGGLAWAFSGPMVVWLGWPHTNALLMVGYLFWTTLRWLQQRSARWWAASALALGLQLLGGHPETTAHTLTALGVFVAVWTLVHVAEVARDIPDRLRPAIAQGGVGVVGWAAAMAAGTGLAGVQVVPTLAAVADSVTAAERGARSLAFILLEPETLITWLVPGFFGTPLGGSYGPIEFLNYNETIGYVGAGTMVLGLVVVLAWRQPSWVPVFAFALVAGGLAYGIPLLTELRRLPGLGHAANTRFVFILAFGLACLGALGLDTCLRAQPSRLRWAAVAIAVLGMGVAGALALAPDLLTPSPEDALPLQPLEAADLRRTAVGKAAALGVMWAVVLAGLTVRRARGVVACGCVTALALDLAVFSGGYNPMVDPTRLTRVPESVGFLLQQGGEGRVVGLGEALLPNAGMIHRLTDLRVYEPIAHRRLLAFFERADPQLAHDIRSRFYLFLWQPSVDLLSLASVRWVMVPTGDPRVAPPERLASAGLIPRFEDRVVAIWENPSARPRAYLADTVITVSDEGEALALLPHVAGAGRMAVVERPLDAGPIGGARAPGEVRMESWPGGAQLTVSAPEGGLLVINDTYYPGWQATVDGVGTPILWTNYLFMGVPLEPGVHTVRLEYRPASVPLGLAVSLIAGLVLVGVVLARRSATPPRR